MADNEWDDDGEGAEWAEGEGAGDDAGDGGGGGGGGGGGDDWGDGDDLVDLADSGAMSVSAAKKAGAAGGGGTGDTGDGKDSGGGSSGLRGVPLYLLLLKQTAKALRKKPTDADRENAAQIIRELYLSYIDDCKDDKKLTPPDLKTRPTECKVCFSEFDSSTRALRMVNCGHESVCGGCFAQYVKIKVRDKDVLPWVRCPDGKCQFPVHGETIANCGCTALELFQFADTFLHKHLVRNDGWVECKGPECRFGFHLEAKDGKEIKAVEKKCEVCFLKQNVEPKRELDDEFKNWIRDGKLRPCPTCKLMTMKEYGVCNVIQCGKCGIWWNWKSRETGKSSKELKDRARAAGSLWEPGELQFQMNLQQTKPEEFKKLLERNGMEYKANYVRGT